MSPSHIIPLFYFASPSNSHPILGILRAEFVKGGLWMQRWKLREGSQFMINSIISASIQPYASHPFILNSKLLVICMQWVVYGKPLRCAGLSACRLRHQEQVSPSRVEVLAGGMLQVQLPMNPGIPSSTSYMVVSYRHGTASLGHIPRGQPPLGQPPMGLTATE